MKTRKGIISKYKDFDVVLRYSENAIKKNLLKFIPKTNKPFEISLNNMVGILSKHVSSETIAPVLLENKIVNMIKTQRALTFTPNRDIKAGETIHIPFEHMMPIEYAVAEEALGISVMSDKVKSINHKQLLLAKERINKGVTEFLEEAYRSQLQKDSQGES
jgi:hypothetical protein